MKFKFSLKITPRFNKELIFFGSYFTLSENAFNASSFLLSLINIRPFIEYKSEDAPKASIGWG